MPPTLLNYPRPLHHARALSLLRTDVLLAVITAAFMICVNVWLQRTTDRFMYMFAFAIGNALLALVCLAFTPLVQRVSGTSGWLHVSISLGGPALAVVAETLRGRSSGPM